LATFDDYKIIMRAANLAAQELLGPSQADEQWVRFVARTDALSAKRIMFSENLRDVNHIDHQFVDWDAGITPDGKYLYIKQGTNAETGNTWGLDMSIARGIEIVKSGLASHIWMETPDADLAVAKIYMDSVNKELEKYGLKARGLYNHSPSFDWDVKFYAEAKKLIDELIRNIPTNIKTQEIASVISHWLESNGNTIIGDNLFTNDSIYKLAQNAHDYLLTSNMRKSQLETLTNMLENEEGIISQDMNIQMIKKNHIEICVMK
jgi:hypothetical protein